MIELPIKISIIEEYNLAIQRGYEPLQDWKRFAIAVPLRIDIQRELFGRSVLSKGDVVKGNQRYYEWCWEKNEPYCEECGLPLQGYSAKFISHILTKGANSEKAHDPRNKNILCFKDHQRWEDERERKKMRIYRVNLKIIDLLNKDYNGWNK